jgi:hypothetical protein
MQQLLLKQNEHSQTTTIILVTRQPSQTNLHSTDVQVGPVITAIATENFETQQRKGQTFPEPHLLPVAKKP